MITLTCTNCNTELHVDDAFAGGVCRCQHCGAIQTVPAKEAAASGSPAAQSKTLYRSKIRSQTGTGLDELADVVASSGTFIGSGLRSSGRNARDTTQPTPPEAADPTSPASLIKAKWPWFASGAGVLLLAIILIIVFAGRNSASNNPPGAFAGIPITGDTIVYVIDRGLSSQDSFGDTIQATLQSVTTLGTNRNFQIIFWNNGTDLAYPTIEPVPATAQNILSAQQALSEVSAFGASDITSAIQRAVKAKPDEIILVTAKGWDLGEAFLTTIQDALKGRKTPIIAVSIGMDSDALRQLAQQTGGSYHELSMADLQAVRH